MAKTIPPTKKNAIILIKFIQALYSKFKAYRQTVATIRNNCYKSPAADYYRIAIDRPYTGQCPFETGTGRFAEKLYVDKLVDVISEEEFTRLSNSFVVS